MIDGNKRFLHWLTRTNHGVFGLVCVLIGVGFLLHGSRQEPLGILDRFAVREFSVLFVGAGLFLIYRAVRGRLPSWFGD